MTSLILGSWLTALSVTISGHYVESDTLTWIGIGLMLTVGIGCYGFIYEETRR